MNWLSVEDLYYYYVLLHIPSGGYFSFMPHLTRFEDSLIVFEDRDKVAKMKEMLCGHSKYLLGSPINCFAFGSSSVQVLQEDLESRNQQFQELEFEILRIPKDKLVKNKYYVV